MTIIDAIRRFLRLEHFSRRTMIEAETENASRTFRDAIHRLTASAASVGQSNSRLREVIRKSRISSFADLETTMKVGGHRDDT